MIFIEWKVNMFKHKEFRQYKLSLALYMLTYEISMTECIITLPICHNMLLIIPLIPLKRYNRYHKINDYHVLKKYR
jgi:hypothetical protein